MDRSPMQEPKKLDLTMLSGDHIVRHKEYRFISSHFGFVNSFARAGSFLFTPGQPYLIKERRIVFVLQGTGRVNINLMTYTLRPGMLVLVGGNSIVHLLEHTPDFDLRMMAIADGFVEPPHQEEFFDFFLNSHPCVALSLSVSESQQINAFLDLIWLVLQDSTFKPKVVSNLIRSLLYAAEAIHESQTESNSTAKSRQEELFQHFIALVNRHCKTERQVSFYADKLCLTPRYLNTVIKQVSGQTVMDWVNQAIILQAKVMLKHSNRLVFEVADELNFPNASFFSKFFRKHTGLSPITYQKKETPSA